MPPKRPHGRSTTKLGLPHASVGAGSTLGNGVEVNAVSAWLASLQLQGYSDALVAEHGFCTLKDLALHIHDEKDLMEMGIKPLAHRRIVMAAIQKNKRAWLAAAEKSPTFNTSVPTAVTSGQMPASLMALDAMDQRGTVRLEPRLSFAQQLEHFKLGGITRTPHVQLPVQPPHASSDAESPQPHQIVADSPSNGVAILSGNSAVYSQASAHQVTLPCDAHKVTSVAGLLSCVDNVGAPNSTRAQCIDAICAVVMAAEADYDADMATLEDDAHAAAATLSELFRQRANAIEDCRQQRLQVAASMAATEDAGHDILDEVAGRVAGERQSSASAQRNGGWTLSIHLSPRLMEPSVAPFAPIRACVDVIHCHPDAAEPSDNMTPATLQNEGPQEPPPERTQLSHHAIVTPQHARPSAAHRSGSAVRSMRHSIRRVEHWLNDDAVVSLPTPVFELDGPASTPPAFPASLQGTGPTTPQGCDVTVSPEEVLSDAVANVDARDCGSPEPTDGANEAKSEQSDNGSIADMINAHVSCSQHVPFRGLQEPPSSPQPRWAHVRAEDIVDVDEVSSYCTSISAHPPPLTSVGGPPPSCPTPHVASMVEGMVPAALSPPPVSRNEKCLDVDNCSSYSDDDNWDVDGDVEVGEAYDTLGEVDMGEGSTSFFCGDELLHCFSSTSAGEGVASDTSTSTRDALQGAGAVPIGGEDTAVLFNDDDEEKALLTPTEVTKGSHPTGRPPLRPGHPNLAHLEASGVRYPLRGASRVMLAFAVPGNKVPFHRQYSAALLEGLSDGDAHQLLIDNGIMGPATTDANRKRPREPPSNGAFLRHELRVLHTRSLFLHRTCDLLASSLPSCGATETTGHTRRRSSREGSLSRLQQAERQCLTQAELNDVRRQIREVETASANKVLVMSLVHQSLDRTVERAHPRVDNEEAEHVAASIAELTPYEAVLLGEGVDIDAVQQVVAKEFPGMTKGRIEAALKVSGVPINLVRDSPKESTRRRFFTKGSWRGRGRGGH